MTLTSAALQPYQQGLIDEAALEALAIVDVLRLAPNIPVIAGDEQMGKER